MTDRDGIAPAPKYGFPANAKGFLFPPVAWAAFFVIIYSVQGAGCASGMYRAEILGLDGLGVILTLITALTAISILVIGLWSYRAWQRARTEAENNEHSGLGQSRFLAAGAALNAGLFLVATLWSGLPIAWTAACSVAA